MYVNGSEVTDFGTRSNPAEDHEFAVNNTVKHDISSRSGWLSTGFYDGLLAEFHFIDGAQLTPSSFGETGDYGEWKPIEVSGLTYGTNGFYLDFADSDNLGDDESGNGNDLAETNIDPTDQMLDTPTNSFATWNPLEYSDGNVEFSEGNTVAHEDSNNLYFGVTPTMFPTSGKWYAEVIFTTLGTTQVGWVVPNTYKDTNINLYSNSSSLYIQLANTGFAGFTAFGAGSYTPSVSGGSNLYTAFTKDAIIQLAWDADNGRAWYGINGTWGNSGDPAAGTNYLNMQSDYANGVAPFASICGCGSAPDSTSTVNINFGQDSSFAGEKTAQGNQDANSIGDFYYTPPTDFLALCTSNLPVPV
jgi:hypothetical protein